MIRIALFLLGCLLLLSSCSSVVRLSVNPDRSGKMEVQLNTMSLTKLATRFGNSSTTKSDTQNQMAQVLKLMMSAMRGVDELSDVEFVEDEESSHLRLTAYFRDFNKLGFQAPMPGAAGGQGNDVSSSRIDEDGNWILTLRTGMKTSGKTEQLTSNTPIDEDQLNLEVMQYQLKMKAAVLVFGKMVAELPPDLGQRMEVVVGGTILKTEGLHQEGPNKAWTFDSMSEMWKSLTTLVTDRFVLRNIIVAAKQQGTTMTSYDPSKLPPEFGQYVTNLMKKIRPDYEAETRLTIRPGVPVFDYQSEVAEAKKHPGSLLTLMRNGAANPPSPPPAPPKKEWMNGPILGVQYGPNPSGGAKVKGVLKGSPAEEGGLHEGDVIQTVDGAELEDERVFGAFIKTLRPNEPVTLGILRDGKVFEMDLTPRVVERPADM